MRHKVQPVQTPCRIHMHDRGGAVKSSSHLLMSAVIVELFARSGRDCLDSMLQITRSTVANMHQTPTSLVVFVRYGEWIYISYL